MWLAIHVAGIPLQTGDRCLMHDPTTNARHRLRNRSGGLPGIGCPRETILNRKTVLRPAATRDSLPQNRNLIERIAGISGQRGVAQLQTRGLIDGVLRCNSNRRRRRSFVIDNRNTDCRHVAVERTVVRHIRETVDAEIAGCRRICDGAVRIQHDGAMSRQCCDQPDDQRIAIRIGIVAEHRHGYGHVDAGRCVVVARCRGDVDNRAAGSHEPHNK